MSSSYLKEYLVNFGFYIGNTAIDGKLYKKSSICIKLLCISRKKISFIMSPYFIKRDSFNFLDPSLFSSSVLSVCPYVCFCACFCLFFLSFYAFFSLSFGFFLSLSIVVKWTVCPCLPMEHIGGVVVSVI